MRIHSRVLLSVVLLVACAGLLAGCGGGGGGDGADQENGTWGTLVWGTDRWQADP